MGCVFGRRVGFAVLFFMGKGEFGRNASIAIGGSRRDRGYPRVAEESDLCLVHRSPVNFGLSIFGRDRQRSP
jgi:hypothetical protein